MRALNCVIFFFNSCEKLEIKNKINKVTFLLIENRCTIFSNHPGEILCTEKHETIKFDVVGQQPATMYIQIS